MQKKSEEVSPFVIGVKYSIVSFLLTIIFLIIFSLVLTYTEIQENTIEPVIIILSSISILICSFVTSKKIKSKGIITGGILGVTYFLLLYILSSIFNASFSLNMYSIIMMISCVITGMIGGILGVNFTRK